MKYSLILLLLMLSFVQVKAQEEELLAKDEQGKLIYYEVVETKELSRDSLKNRLLQYFKANKGFKLISMLGDSSFNAGGKLIVEKTLLALSHPSGEIAYRFDVEIKTGKYRFWLSDFSFIPYQRDRYGNFVPSTVKGMPLETKPKGSNPMVWKEYQLLAAKQAKSLAIKFKQLMAGQTLNLAPVQKVVVKNW